MFSANLGLLLDGEVSVMSVCRDLHDKGISTWFSFHDSVCKSINVKASDPSAMIMLQSFLCEKFRIYWSTISSFSKLNTLCVF